MYKVDMYKSRFFGLDTHHISVVFKVKLLNCVCKYLVKRVLNNLINNIHFTLQYA